MGARIARECVRRLLKRGSRGGVVTVLGVTFKENLPDLRNSKVIDIVRELESFGIKVQVRDPWADRIEAFDEYGIELSDHKEQQPADAVVLAVAHDTFINLGWPFLQTLLKEGQGLVLDVKSRLERASKPAEIELWRL